jgi:hypothetical protein
MHDTRRRPVPEWHGVRRCVQRNGGRLQRPAATPCTDEGNGCTDDACDGAGACVHTANAAPCDDGVFCNGTDTCTTTTCSVHTGDPCTGGLDCQNACSEAMDGCTVLAGAPCVDDGNPCTDDICDGAGGCTHSEQQCAVRRWGRVHGERCVQRRRVRERPGCGLRRRQPVHRRQLRLRHRLRERRRRRSTSRSASRPRKGRSR